jgi:3-hydroxyacyl-[acyl-carrier-protein] dehydratase
VKFNLIDKIDLLTDEKIVASKFVSLAEEYLADHFPTFPVLPGVMMLEAATQAAGWVLHRRTNFAKSMAVLKESRNVRYGNFVAPGNFLRIEAELLKSTEGGGTFKVHGAVVNSAGQASDAPAITGRIEIALFDLAEKQPELADLDVRLKEHNRLRWKLLEQAMPKQPAPAVPATQAVTL